MAKIAIKYDNIVPYGGIFYAMSEFKRTGLDKLVDGRLNVRCANYGYQYSDIMLALFCIYLCGGDHIEDITTILNKYLSTAPGARIPSSDTIARGLKELRALSIAYTSKTGSVYAHDPAMKLNSLLLDMTLLLGLLKKGQGIDVDFDNEFIPAEKSDALFSYKKKRKRIGIHVLLQKKLSKGGGLLSFVSLLWMVANGQVIDSCISPMAY